MATAQRRVTPQRTEYLNVTQGWLGVVKINPRNGNETGEPVPPGGRVFLTDEEVELTGQKHARIEDSPFHPREIVYTDPATHEELGRAELCPLEKAEDFRRSGGQVPVPPPIIR